MTELQTAVDTRDYAFMGSTLSPRSRTIIETIMSVSEPREPQVGHKVVLSAWADARGREIAEMYTPQMIK